MVSEDDWNTDKRRFIADADAAATQGRAPARDHGFPLGPLGQQFAILTYSLLDALTVGEVLEQVVDAATGLFPAVDLVSVTLRSPDGQFHTPVETNTLASELDQVQYRLGEGPCLEAADPAGPAVAFSDDLHAEAPWPKWARAATDLGVAAVLSTALIPQPGPRKLSGALNLYSRRPHGLDDIDRDQVLLMATHASLAVAITDATSQAQLRETHLRRAIDSRDVIGQAKGIIMARRGVPADEAFDILRRTSQQLNVKLVELAETLAARHAELDVSELPKR
jgi:hypothetical protein